MSEELLTNEISTQAPAERMYTTTEVNQIVGRKKAEVEEKYRKRQDEQPVNTAPVFDKQALIEEAKAAAKAEMMQEIGRHKQAADQQRQADLEKAAQADLQKDAIKYLEHVKGVEVPHEEDALKLFTAEGQHKYAALCVMGGNINHPDTVDIMKELARNPRKLRELNAAAKDEDKDYVRLEFNKIADSIKQNKQALSSRSNTKSPLTQLKTSTVDSSSSKQPTISELRKASWLRG